jgi:hypothetical protein
MAIARPVILVELLMSADRVITAAQRPRDAAPAPGDWPVATVLGHLSMVDLEVWIPRIDAMVAARSDSTLPRFDWWEPDSERTLAVFADVDVDTASARLLASRTALLHRLRDLSDDDWSARADHEAFGTIDVEGLMLQVLAHDEEHRASILLLEPEV